MTANRPLPVADCTEDHVHLRMALDVKLGELNRDENPNPVIMIVMDVEGGAEDLMPISVTATGYDLSQLGAMLHVVADGCEQMVKDNVQPVPAAD
jgi:hypothetical protein